MSRDRRESLRVHDSRLITEIVSERPWAASVVNFNAKGLFSIKPALVGLYGPKIIQVEIPIPEASESVWAKGKVVFESLNPQRVGAGIQFLAMADRHRRLLIDVVEMHRQEMMTQLAREIQLRKELGAFPTPYIAPPPLWHGKPIRLQPKKPVGRPFEPSEIVIRY